MSAPPRARAFKNTIYTVYNKLGYHRLFGKFGTVHKMIEQKKVLAILVEISEDTARATSRFDKLIIALQLGRLPSCTMKFQLANGQHQNLRSEIKKL